ncbi:MAG TPA: serpin family protein [Candidatus Cloacimonetes bacterium]|nr:serpin family protein [Candidatus Cloacimonadota bacterium]HEX37389.1 serpin family protein [Candidatus Cloacimonadota bacterium]
MKRINVILVGLLVVLLCTCSESTGPGNDMKDSDERAGLVQNELIEANIMFALDVFKKTIEHEPNNNISISPISLAIALSMTYNGAQEETAEQMAQTLHYQDICIDVLNKQYSHLIQSLQTADTAIQLNLANSIWIRNSFPVLTDFIDTIENNYFAEIISAPFDQTTVTDINDWIEDKTNGKITEMIQNISYYEQMFLINALYFKGNWKYTFDPEETENEHFYMTGDSIITVQMMKSSGKDYTYLFDDHFSLCRMPYGRDVLAMYILLPNYNYTIEEILDEFDTNAWLMWKNSLATLPDEDEYEYFEFHLPKFKIEYEKKFNDILADLGMQIPFTVAANFGKMTPEILWINYVKQKTFIEVNEEGTEAAAATVVSMASGISPSFIVDRPFIYVLCDDRTDTILFMGKVINPQYE